VLGEVTFYDHFILKIGSAACLLYLIAYRGPDAFMEELDADDGQQADAHSQDDG